MSFSFINSLSPNLICFLRFNCKIPYRGKICRGKVSSGNIFVTWPKFRHFSSTNFSPIRYVSIQNILICELTEERDYNNHIRRCFLILKSVGRTFDSLEAQKKQTVLNKDTIITYLETTSFSTYNNIL